MTARDLLSNLRASNVSKPADMLLCMANLAHELRLSDGQRLNDQTDFTQFLRELAEAVEYFDVREQAQSRVRKFCRPTHDHCPSCSHVHEGIWECGVDMGGGGKCTCKMEVTA